MQYVSFRIIHKIEYTFVMYQCFAYLFICFECQGDRFSAMDVFPYV